MANFNKEKLVNYIGLISFFILISLFLCVFFLYFISHSLIGVSDSDRYFMKIAYEEAELTPESEPAKVGAILVLDGKIVSRAHNDVKAKKDWRNHAEMLAINDALNILRTSHFNKIKGNVTLYTTYEPCPMCEGFIVGTRVPRVIVGREKKIEDLFKRNFIGHILYRLNERGGLTKEKCFVK
ncbi:MAG: nucleoside deaminase [Candidatus Omnitrophica bacterium]|nr:nucleoside deaminase [Candidatus Omnitrophota bacterium]HOX55148.1 nucleoside deaminase [Candidatus Omnitrophota bacterium]